MNDRLTGRVPEVIQVNPPISPFCSYAIKGMLGDAGHLSIPILEVVVP